MQRCGWVKENNPLYIAYHDEEWGQPLHDDQKLFELLCLETYQAGLSWETVLNKRAAFKKAFHNYDAQKVAHMSDQDLDRLMENPEIIRNKRKIYSTRANALAFLKIQEEFASFDAYLWSFVNGKSVNHNIENYQEVPSKTALSENLSKDLKKKGFKFVGPVCIYSYLQAAGLINDHEISCDFNPNKREA